MSKVIKGSYIGTGLKIGILIGQFNEAIGKQLLEGAIDCLERHGVAGDDITTVWVPGAFEIPLAAQKMAKSGKYDAILALGAVIRGATTHYDYVAGGSANGIQSVSLETGVPISLGIVTTENIEQAWERAGTKAGNNGAKAALAGIEMANLLRELG